MSKLEALATSPKKKTSIHNLEGLIVLQKKAIHLIKIPKG